MMSVPWIRDLMTIMTKLFTFNNLPFKSERYRIG